jgi:transcriptional regulator with XRE-family HTH domain
MKQPDLGKKIAELRKAKGLTQDELVQKCNLSIRTLQRIESGEVTPRSYTLKTIFTALDYNVNGSLGIINGITKFREFAKKWLEQVYLYVIDLFNLKTNTMKKVTILSIPLLIAGVILFQTMSSNAKAQSRWAIQEKFENASSNNLFTRLFNSCQMDSLSQLYYEKACMMPDQYSTLNDRKSIQEYYKHLYNQGLRFAEIKTLSKVFTDSIAIDRGIWSISINSVIVAKGTYLSQWHYYKGKWYIENEMTKTDNLGVAEN